MNDDNKIMYSKFRYNNKIYTNVNSRLPYVGSLSVRRDTYSIFKYLNNYVLLYIINTVLIPNVHTVIILTNIVRLVSGGSYIKCHYLIGLSRLIDSNRIESIQVANRLIDSKRLNRFTETIHYFYLFNGIVARKCQQIDFYLT